MKWMDALDALNVLGRAEAIAGAVYYSTRRSKRHPQQPAGIVELRAARDHGESGADVQRMLRAHGVQTWGGRTTGDWFVMYIKRSQAEWAVGILRGAGLDIQTSPPIITAPTTAKTRWQDRGR